MNGFIITQDQINKLRRAHRSTKDKRAADRIKAIYSLAVGYSAKEIADILMIDDETLRNYVKRYQEGGVKALLENNHKGSSANLSEMELKELELHVKSNSYLSADGIVDYVYKTYGINYSVSGMTQLLHRLGFVYKKAKIIPGKANAEAQEAYLTMLMKLLENKDESDPHYFTDGVHPQHNTMPSHGWVKKGEDKIIKTNSARKRININGALNSETLEVITHTDETINAQSTIELFKAIEAKHPLAKNIYITLDNAQYYRSKLVKAYLETSKIKLLFLPSYAPNLNLIERLWVRHESASLLVAESATGKVQPSTFRIKPWICNVVTQQIKRRHEKLQAVTARLQRLSLVKFIMREWSMASIIQKTTVLAA